MDTAGATATANGSGSTTQPPAGAGAGTGTGAYNSTFHLPAELQEQLLDDFELVTKEYRLVPLPRKHNVNAILRAWLARDANVSTSTREVGDGLKAYFDVALPTMLLYKVERPQYNELRAKAPSNVYGAEHLVRLLVKLPFMLEAAQADPHEVQRIADKVNDLAKFLVDNGRLIFALEYTPPDPAYLDRVRAAAAGEEPPTAE